MNRDTSTSSLEDRAPTKMKLTSSCSVVATQSKPMSRTQSAPSNSSSASTKPSSKISGSSKVQVHYPLYTYREISLSAPLPPPKRRYIRDMMDANDALINLDSTK